LSIKLPTPGPRPDAVSVVTVSGDTLTVMGEGEAAWYNRSRDEYLRQTKLTEVTDRNDLDRLLFMELMVFRWGLFLSAGKDYQELDVDEAALKRNLRDYSDQLNKLKEAMGLSRRSRDAAANAGDFSKWLEEVKRRARLFGIHRQKQAFAAVVGMYELMAKVETFYRCDEEERGKLGFADERAILDWARQELFPKFREIDERFRREEQQYWTKD
jgi:hypothetical protein